MKELKTVLILLICWAFRISPEYEVISSIAWGMTVYCLVWLDEEKPWKYIVGKAVASSMLFLYATIVYLIGIHLVILL